ncbi:hypothetical protein U0035_01260 [Niabella yanshanensis]|uniref:DUF4377 domain-containing protein n=1 Tax=Niabella yanshanensis TaxID=577386 RepID=A0ABZ0W9L7_9BACT|nr:hypothetical protein [Niabella yanshanensis]WQD38771.1 hypothetical protein U0035_01260 [Niabella yanshanensis]
MNSLLIASFRYLYLISFFLCLTFAVNSCSKEEKEIAAPDFPVQLSFDQLSPVSEMRFFVGGVELNGGSNQQSLQSFLERKYTTNTGTGTIHYQSGFIEPDANNYKNTSFTYNSYEQVKYVVDIIEIKRQNDITILKSKVTNRVDLDPIVQSELFKYQFDINSNGTYNYQYVVNETDQSLEVSLLYYKLVRYNDQGEREDLAFGKVHNQFNELFIKTLGARDTLAIKEYRLKYVAP